MQDSDNKHFTVVQIAEMYGQTVPVTRRLLTKELKKSAASKNAVVKGTGRKASVYPWEVVVKALGKEPVTSSGSLVLPRNLFGSESKAPIVRIIIEPEGKNPLFGLLTSRRKCRAEYDELVGNMARNGEDLRIWAVTGTDFFDAHSKFFQALTPRIPNRSPKVLLLYPDCAAAHLRSAAEGEDTLETSQFRRDAERTIKFLQVYKDKLGASVVWADVMPPSLLVWTRECALVEPYDYGREDDILVGCTGRTAPIMVVAGGTDYHKALKNSFDYVFNHTENKDLQTYDLDTVFSTFIPGGKRPS
jgi:hypothetical protein